MCTISHLLCDKKQLSCFYSKILKDKSINELMFFGGGGLKSKATFIKQMHIKILIKLNIKINGVQVNNWYLESPEVLL